MLAVTAMASLFAGTAAAAAAAAAKSDIRVQLIPRQYTTLASELPARVKQVSVRDGDSFRSGQLLVSLDCTVQVAQLEKARAALNAAEYTNKANQQLLAMKSIGDLESQLSGAEVVKARAEVAVLAATIAKCDIKAPFSGRVATQKVRDHEYVQIAQPLLEIIDSSKLELEFIVPSVWLAWLKPGITFQVRIDETGKEYPARVTRLGARVDAVSQSIKVTGEFASAFPELLAGMSGKALLTPPTSP
jgi:RND family efflux transporter MFP subunit